MNPENPYEVLPDHEHGSVPAIEVDESGTLLIAESPVLLPDRCVFTNQPTGPDDVVTTSLQWVGKKSFSLTFTKTCEIRYSATVDLRRTSRWAKVGFAMSFALCILMGLSMSGVLSWIEVLILAGLLVTLTVGGRLAGKGAPHLEVVDYQQKRFFIEGCCPEFLQQLRAELEA